MNAIDERAANNMQLERLKQKLAGMKAESMRRAAEESGKRRVLAAENACDLYKYHKGMTEVIDVEPVKQASEREADKWASNA